MGERTRGTRGKGARGERTSGCRAQRRKLGWRGAWNERGVSGVLPTSDDLPRPNKTCRSGIELLRSTSVFGLCRVALNAELVDLWKAVTISREVGQGGLSS